MNPRSSKNKGNRFENYLIEVFREQLDPKAQRTYGSGSGLDKNDIRLPNYDIEIEAKNANTYKLGKDWEQLKRQRTQSTNVLAIRNPKLPEFEETMVVMDLGDFIELLKKQGTASMQAELPKDLLWKVKRLEESAKDVFKYLKT